MPSLSALLLPALLLLSPSLAAPTATPDFDISDLLSHAADRWSPPSTLPASALPSPGDKTLKYIALGLGTQNYTCATADSTAAPVANGAKATLYDATGSKQLFLDNTRLDLACAAHRAGSGLGLPKLGVHYFTAALVPSFDLVKAGAFLAAKKIAATPAPADACTSKNGAAAVPWLTLDDNGSGVSKGVNRVYRVRTTGGSAPASCDGLASSFTVDYAAEYWFYA